MYVKWNESETGLRAWMVPSANTSGSNGRKVLRDTKTASLRMTNESEFATRDSRLEAKKRSSPWHY